MSLLLRLQRLAAEFRRRSVFRVTAIYLAAVFVVLQVGDIVSEPLGLPAWTMALLIVMSGAGFVLTVVLAWVYEVTPDGVRRTPDGEPAGETAIRGRPVDRRRLAITAGLVLALLGGGWIARTTLSRNLAVDAGTHAIAVLPFRVAGAGPELAYMREGIVDLLSALLTDRAELPVVPPRVLLRELGDVDAGADMRTQEVARRVGANRMIIGEVVGRADHVTLTATLYDMRNGRRVHASTSGPERELDMLVERLAAQLVARDNPLTTERLASLEGVPLAALRHYLHAMSLQRRGRFADSMEPLRTAMEIDSTFALAALAFDVAAGWAPADPDEIRRMQMLAWEHRDRLNAMDRLHLEAQIWTYPDLTAPAVRLRRLEQALARMPERHELWYEYGDLLVHEGQAIGVPDWRDRARGAFERALVVAPDHIESNYHLAELAYEAGDTAAMEAAARVLEAGDGAERISGVVKGLRALMRDDAASWQALRALPPVDLNDAIYALNYYALLDGRGVDSLLAISRDLERSAVTAAEASEAANRQFWLLMNTGRPTEALRIYNRYRQQQGPRGRLEGLQLTAWAGLAWDGDSIAGRDALEALRGIIDAQMRVEGSQPVQPFYICTVAVADLLAGRTAWATRALPWLARGAEELDTTLERAQARGCAVIIAAGAAHASGSRAEATARLAELETYLRESPFGSKRLRSAGNFVAAILHEHYGDPQAAVIAWQRLQDTMAPNLLTTALREEARLLDALGRREEATVIYSRYLVLRKDAEPRLQARDEPIRRRLAPPQEGIRQN